MGWRAVCPIPGGRYGDVEQIDRTAVARDVTSERWRLTLPAMPRYLTCVYVRGWIVALCTQARDNGSGDDAVLLTPTPRVIGKSLAWPHLWTDVGGRVFATIVRDRNTWETFDVTATIFDRDADPVSVRREDTPAGSDSIGVLGIAYMRNGWPVWRAPVDSQGRVKAGYAWHDVDRPKLEPAVRILLPIRLADGTIVGQLKGSDWIVVSHRGGLSTILKEPAEASGCVLDDGSYVFGCDYLQKPGSKVVRVVPPAWPPFARPTPKPPDPKPDEPDPKPDPDEDDMTDADRKLITDWFARLERKVDELKALVKPGGPTDPPIEPPVDPPTNPTDPEISSVRFIDPPDVGSWPQTSTIGDVTIRPAEPTAEELAEVCIRHTKLGEWPEVTPSGVTVEGCPWVIFETPDGLVGCTYEWYRPGQACKKFYVGNLHRSVRSLWNVKSGDRVGFMVSTLARDANRSPRNERSQILWVTWP